MKSEAVLVAGKIFRKHSKNSRPFIIQNKSRSELCRKQIYSTECPSDKLQEIIDVLPGMKAPTVLPLATAGWSSVHSVIKEDTFWEIIEQLKDLGAEGILVLEIEKMIL